MSDMGTEVSELTPTEFVTARLDEKAKKADLDENMGHISPDDFARALAECSAMRQIVELHSGEPCCETCYDLAPVDSPCPTIRSLASIWSDHPDWREEWR